MSGWFLERKGSLWLSISDIALDSRIGLSWERSGVTEKMWSGSEEASAGERPSSKRKHTAWKV